MPTSCSALRCTNRQKKGSGITFHSFPLDPVRRKKWVSAIGRIGWTPSVHASLCSVHFEEKCFDRTGQTVRLREGSVPTVFISSLTKRYRTAKKISDTFSDVKIKQEKENVEKTFRSKRQCVAHKKEMTEVQELDLEDHTYPKKICVTQAHKQEEHCFVCDKVVKNGTSLSFLTNTTKIQMHHKLDKIIAQELDVLVKENGVLCSHCARLINYMDRIEVELAMLNRKLLCCIRGKHVLGLSHKDLQNMLPQFDEKLPGTVPVFSEMRSDDFKIADFCKNQWTCNTVHEEEKDLGQKSFKCHICSFKTNYKSTMIYHLRQHLRTSYRCDFCHDWLPKDTKPHKGKECLLLKETKFDVLADDVSLGSKQTRIETLPKETENTIEISEAVCPPVTESKIEMKNHLVDTLSVENMLEELHNTGQVSAFLNSDSNVSKMNTPMETIPNMNNALPESKVSACMSIKLESMQVNKGETFDDVRISGQDVASRNSVLINYPVKCESQSASYPESVNGTNVEVSEIHQSLLQCEKRFVKSPGICETKPLTSAQETAR